MNEAMIYITNWSINIQLFKNFIGLKINLVKSYKKHSNDNYQHFRTSLTTY